MRVCVVVPYDLAEEGGVKRHAVHVAAALRAVGDEVWIIGPSSTGGNHGAWVHGFAGVVNVPANGSDNYLGIFIRPWQVRSFMREHRFDVVHLHEPIQPSLSYYALWSSPEAAHICTFHAYVEDESRALRWSRQVFSRLLFPLVDRGIAVSDPAERYARIVWQRPLTVIPNGVPTKMFRSPTVEAPLDGRPLRLLFVGHWRDPRKGLPFLLEACGELKRMGFPFTLDVVGGGREAPRLDGVTFHGPVSDERVIAEHYRRCDLFIAPATGQESFGIVLLEAMASSRPVVASDIAGYRQVVEPEGAAWVPPGDAGAIARAIVELAGDPARRRRMGELNRRRAEEHDWDRLALRVRDEYVTAIESKHGAVVGKSHRLAAPTQRAVS